MMMTIQKHTQTDTHTYTTTVDLHRNFQAEYPEHTRTQRGTNKAKGNKIRHQILQNKKRNSPLEEARSQGSIKWREIGARKSQKIGRSADLSVSLSLSLSLSLRERTEAEKLCLVLLQLWSSFLRLPGSFKEPGRPGKLPGSAPCRPAQLFFTYLPTLQIFLRTLNFFFLPFTVTSYFYPDFNCLPTLYFLFLFLPLYTNHASFTHPSKFYLLFFWAPFE
jgi:hypothetical protein